MRGVLSGLEGEMGRCLGCGHWQNGVELGAGIRTVKGERTVRVCVGGQWERGR